MNNLKIILPTN